MFSGGGGVREPPSENGSVHTGADQVAVIGADLDVGDTAAMCHPDVGDHAFHVVPHLHPLVISTWSVRTFHFMMKTWTWTLLRHQQGQRDAAKASLTGPTTASQRPYIDDVRGEKVFAKYNKYKIYTNKRRSTGKKQTNQT